MKIFISQPMHGRSLQDMDAERELARRHAEATYGGDVDVLDQRLPLGGHSPLCCLGHSLQIMAQADVVYFCGSWVTSRGCVIEQSCAEAYEKRCHYL